MQSILFPLLLALVSGAALAGPEPGAEPRPNFAPNLAFDMDAPGAVRAQLSIQGKEFEPFDVELKADGDRIAGGIYIPPGEGVLVSLAAFDERGEAIYKGEAFANIDEKLTRQVSIPLAGKEDKLEARLGTYLLDLAWASGEGDRLVLQATLLDAFGKQVPFEPEELDWGLPKDFEFELLPYSCFQSSLCIELPDPSVYAARIACLRDFTCWNKPPKNNDGPYLRVAVGRNHTCALLKSGEIRCWGDNFAGQLGAPTGACQTGRWCSPDPVAVVCPAGEVCRFKSVSAGADHTCAVDTAGKAWCWGEKQTAATGEDPVNIAPDSPAHRHIPAHTDLGAVVNFASIDTGALHTCALSTAQDIFCWGLNSRSQLGFPAAHGNGSRRATFVRSGNKYRAVSVNGLHSCAIHASGGVMDCWGENFDRQLTGNSNSSLFITINSKVPLLTGKSADLIAAGPTSTCAQVSGTDVVCWGSPSTGAPFTTQTQGYVALRNAYVKSMASDADICAPVGAACTRICVAGGYPDLYCGKWSTSAVAQLSPVAPPKNYSYISYVQVDVGPNHVCALTTHTDIYCFGLNSFGQFGTGAQSSLLTHSPEAATRR